MDGTLEKSFIVHTKLNGTVTVDKVLGEGGEGTVYLVDYNGQKKAMKWYKKSRLNKPDAFYDNISKKIKCGAPSKEFLWPLDITEWVDGTFGYIMDLRPDGYYEVSDFLLTNVRFKSFRSAVDAGIHIANAYRILHNSGYSYQDLNDGNFFINPENGRVLICDNDNVAPDKTETGIVGKPGYMAPEVVLRKQMPNSLSDRFSMSVIIYMILCLNHPLDGKRTLKYSCLTEKAKMELYGSNPIFTMDPEDDSNRPHPSVHANTIILWKCLPEYVKQVFVSAFSKKSFEKPSARPKEIDWLNVLTRFRSEIVPCSCGNEVFTEQGKSCVCEECGKRIQIPYRLEMDKYSIPVIPGSRLYRCQLGVCNEAEALTPVFMVIQSKDGSKFGVRNKSGKLFNAITSKGEPKKVHPDEVVPLKDGITLKIFDEEVRIKANSN